MRIFVTGGTGFVGSHIVVALIKAGHDVRVLARRPEQVERTFAPHDMAPTDIVVGDVRDAAVVSTALTGCDAVVHAAAVFSLKNRDVSLVADTNVAAARTVLAAAVAAGCDPIVHISSTVALTRRDGSGPDLPLGDLDLPYCRSKLDSERVARDLQQTGAPVVSVYPGSVYGPHDPYLGEQDNRLRWVARGLFPIWPKGGLHTVDVRDVAATVVACMEPGRGPRRYVVPGSHVDGRQLYAAVSAALGRRRPHVELGRPVLALTRSMIPLNRVLPRAWTYPADVEGAAITLHDTRMDDSAARTELGLTPAPLDTTIGDTLTWLVDAGHLPARLRPRA